MKRTISARALFLGCTAGSLCLAVVTAALFRTLGAEVWLTLAITFGTVFYHFFMRLLAAAAVTLVLRGGVNAQAPWFREKPFEKRLYALLRIRGIKKYLPTYAPETFDLRERSLREVAEAMCRAEVVHEVIIPLCFLPIAASARLGAAPVFVITSVLSACADALFVMLQRYNRPRVLRAMARREERCLHSVRKA